MKILIFIPVLALTLFITDNNTTTEILLTTLIFIIIVALILFSDYIFSYMLGVASVTINSTSIIFSYNSGKTIIYNQENTKTIEYEYEPGGRLYLLFITNNGKTKRYYVTYSLFNLTLKPKHRIQLIYSEFLLLENSCDLLKDKISVKSKEVMEYNLNN
ncbi:MAG: hypothetical protein N4A72_15940 [Bacteroidales bacterium]|nr:hypothetical protein [Bacteroidales bacterium]